MAFSNLSSAQVGRLIALIKKKESLQAKLTRIDSELQSIESGGDSATAPKRRGRKPGRPATAAKASPAKNGRRGKRGKRLKEPLLKALKSKKIKGISKVGEAKYAYSA
jgi:hypothetical protein